MLYILSLCFLLEVLNSIFIWFKISRVELNTLGLFAHQVLWLLLLKRNITSRYPALTILLFIVFGIINTIMTIQSGVFNFYTFIAGAFLYVMAFLYENLIHLKKEDISFFLSDTYLLLFAPVLFFFGLTFMFGFDSKTLRATPVVYRLALYELVAYLVNIIYYGLILFYIARTKKIYHGR